MTRATAYRECAEAAVAAASEQQRFSVELAEDAAALTERARQLLRERRDERSRLVGLGAELLRALAGSSEAGRAQPEEPPRHAPQRAPAAQPRAVAC